MAKKQKATAARPKGDHKGLCIDPEGRCLPTVPTLRAEVQLMQVDFYDWRSKEAAFLEQVQLGRETTAVHQFWHELFLKEARVSLDRVWMLMRIIGLNSPGIPAPPPMPQALADIDLTPMPATPDVSRVMPETLAKAKLDQALAAVDSVVGWCDQCDKVGGPKPNTAPSEPQTIKELPTAGTGVAPRNAWFLQQYEAHGTDTYHKPAKIQGKWWHMTDEERAAICPDCPGKATRPTVTQGIKLARKQRDGAATKSKRKRTASKA